MKIPQKLVKLRFHFLAALVISVILFTLILVAPKFITLFTYFWPLFLSTAIVLALVFIFATSSSSLPDTDSSLDKTLLDYVAAGHLDDDAPFHTHNNNKSD